MKPTTRFWLDFSTFAVVGVLGLVGCQSFNKRLDERSEKISAKDKDNKSSKPATATKTGPEVAQSKKPVTGNSSASPAATAVAATAKAERALRTQIEPVGRRLAAAAGRPTVAFRFESLYNPRPRTHHTEDGSIYVSSGMLEQLKDTNELAAVLALEMAEFLAEKDRLEGTAPAETPATPPGTVPGAAVAKAKQGEPSDAVRRQAQQLLQQAGFPSVDMVAMRARVQKVATREPTGLRDSRMRELFAN